MKGIFIAGTDTGVGKTIITGLLAKYLCDAGHNVITQKWIQTGSPGFKSSDVMAHLRIAGFDRKKTQKYSDLMLPYVFKTPCSPHLASCIEKREINRVKIIKSFRQLSRDFDFVLVEGVGGTLVPYNKKDLVVDIAARLKLPVLIVAQNKLGAINHTLLTIEALKKRKIRILGLIFNDIRNEKRRILEDNPRIVKALTKEKLFGVLPREKRLKKLYAKFLPMGKRLKKELKI